MITTCFEVITGKRMHDKTFGVVLIWFDRQAAIARSMSRAGTKDLPTLLIAAEQLGDLGNRRKHLLVAPAHKSS